MSLIQEALDKTQNKVNAPGKKVTGGKAEPRVDALKGLGALDREVERKIFEIQKRPLGSQASKRPHAFLFFALVVLFALGLIYWSQNSKNTEPVPPLVVSIERHNVAPKSKSEIAAIFSQNVPAAQSSAVAEGRFLLSGIAGGEGQPYAVINGQILRAGETVDKQALVQSIESDHVTLDYHGELIRLDLKR